MSKKSKPTYWQSSDLNSREALLYRDWIIGLALQRYKWKNLPASCDERWLEWCLLTSGAATIAKPKEGLQAWVSTQYAADGEPNIYQNPTSWRSVGNNGWNFEVDPTNGVVVYDNRLRIPPIVYIDLWADRLAKCDRIYDINLLHQSVPWIMKGPQERQNDMVQLIKQAFGGEPAVLGLKGIEDIQVEMMMTPTPFIGEDIQDSKQRVWNEVYTWLGIDNIERKGERMIEEEVLSTNMPTELRRLDGLTARREACKELNDRFGLDIDVVWNEDLKSKNFNFAMNLEKLEEVDDGIFRTNTASA